MRSITIISFLAFSLNGFSQVNANQWLIAGSGSYSFSKSKNLKSSNLQLSTAGGYFFIDKMAGGLRFTLGSETYHWPEKTRNSSFIISPFLRYYFLATEQKVNILADASYGFAWSKHKDFTYNSKYTYHFNTYSVQTGPSFFLNEHTSLEVTIGYTYLTRGPIDSTSTNRLQVNFGLQVHLGKP